MFSDYTKELPSSWNDPKVEEWKVKAKLIIKNHYLGFNGQQWHQFNLKTERNPLRAKICYALFGWQTDVKDENVKLEELYDEEQKKKGDEIIDKMKSVSTGDNLKVGFLVIACKKSDSEFQLPIFAICIGQTKSKQDIRQYVDSNCRTYKSWVDWQQNNTLPMMKYAFPTQGFFSSSLNKYEFDPEKEPCVSFGNSPQCDTWNRIFRQTDTVSGIVSLGSGVIMVASLFTPVGPAVLAGSAIAGGSSAFYGTTRAACRLYDKGNHGESLNDLESLTLWMSIIATPLHTASSAVNYTLVRGAVVQGRTFTSTIRGLATLLNFTTVGVDGTMLAFALANMVEKYNNDQLSTLDVVQFSMSVFFFTNTLIQPKTARGIIKKAQESHFKDYHNKMTDDDARRTFQKFIDDNKGKGSITDNSKIVRTVNRIKDPESFFKNVKDSSSLKIGGRKGKTIVITDHHNNQTRINPNRVQLTTITQGKVRLSNTTVRKLKSCYGEDLEDVELNNRKIFQQLDDRQKGRLKKVFAKSANYDRNIVETAHKIAEDMNFNTADEVLSVIEIVAADVKGKLGDDFASCLQKIGGSGRKEFIAKIRSDLKIAERVARRADLKFSDPLLAVYHYRKHGRAFPNMINGDKLNFYVGKLPKMIFKDEFLTKIDMLQDGTVRKFYSMPNDNFGVITERPGCRLISSMYKHHGSFSSFLDRIERVVPSQMNPEMVLRNLASALGFSAMKLFVNVDGTNPTPFNECQGLDRMDKEEIVRQVYAYLPDDAEED